METLETARPGRPGCQDAGLHPPALAPKNEHTDAHNCRRQHEGRGRQDDHSRSARRPGVPRIQWTPLRRSLTWSASNCSGLTRALAGRQRRAATFLRKVGVEIGFGREGRARTRTIHITMTPHSPGTETAGALPSASSVSSTPITKPNPANGFAAAPRRTVANHADCPWPGHDATVRSNPLKTGVWTAADDADEASAGDSGPVTEAVLAAKATDDEPVEFDERVAIAESDGGLTRVVLSRDSRSSEKFMHGIKVLMAKNYIDNLSEEARKGMREKAEQGLWSTFAELGYRNILAPNGKRIIKPDPELAPLIRGLFESYAHGTQSIKEATQEARSAGLTFRKSGSRIPTSTVHKMLRTRLYMGDFDWNSRIYPGTHEPIVPKDLWDRVQSVLDGRKAR